MLAVTTDVNYVDQYDSNQHLGKPSPQLVKVTGDSSDQAKVWTLAVSERPIHLFACSLPARFSSQPR